MASTLEKMLILKTVKIFADTPDEVLNEVVELLQELEVEAGETIFEKGDMGTSMYIIVSGRVRVHDDEMTLNYLGTRSVFGEMAALDPEPRSASVTAVEPTRLFRLDQALFYGLMQKRIEVVQGVIHVLCQHLRARMRDLREDFTYMQQFARVTAAAVAIENDLYDPHTLDEVAQRTDELGQLARVFQRMAREVSARQERLKQQVQELRVEIDQARKARQVAEITETEFFQTLRQRARTLRQEVTGGQDEETE